MKKRIISLCLCIVMILGIIPLDTFALSKNSIPIEEKIPEQSVEEEKIVEEEPVVEEELIVEELQEEAMTAEKLADLFRELPSAASITKETSEEEKTNIMTQLEEAVSAYDEMLENNPKEAEVFEKNYAQLYLDAMDLNDALTGNYSEVYAHHAYNPNSTRNTTITVTNTNGQPVTDAVITVTDNWGDTYAVGEIGNGQYRFTRYDRYSREYVANISHSDYESNSARIYAYNDSVTVTLNRTEDLSGENWQNFNVYYISTGQIPNSYAGGGDAANYGPSGNNTPLVTIRVDINKLRREYEDVVVYEKNNGNQWHLIPEGEPKNLTATIQFWEAVKACMDDESIKAFEDTGLFGHFVGYVLKKQNDSSQHADGILNVTPPVYVLEFYKNEAYFGGSVTDKNGTFKTIADVQDAYENNIGVEITWNADGLSGSFMTADNAYTISITQTNLDSAVNVPGSTIKYKQINSEYYLATFNCTITEGAAGYHTVKYTDGVTGEVLFADQTYVKSAGSKVPAFEGDPKDKYPGYHFNGWKLDGGDGTLLSAETIDGMTVQSNMIFHAQWSRVPTEFEATINVVLNETYTADIKTMLGNSNAKLYVSADGKTFFPLENTAVGEYKANLPNGSYSTYYSFDDGQNYQKLDERVFVIASTEGGRKVKFNSVSYDLDGGTSDPVIPAINYYHAGTAVHVSSVVPQKADHVFDGWKNDQGDIYNSGDLLTDYIDSADVLTAQWEKAVDVKVTVIINHGLDTTEKNDEVEFSLVEVRSGTTIHTGLSKSLSETSHEGFDYSENASLESISYKPTAVTFADLPDADYTVNCFKAGYEISVDKTVEDGVHHITLTLNYNPKDFALKFDVKMDDSAKDSPELWPQAVRVKAVRWEEEGWVVVPQHNNTSVRVSIDKTTGTGSGQVNVPQHWPSLETQAADYRIIVTAYEMPDGSTVQATSVPGGKYVSLNGVYEGVVTIEEAEEGRIPTYPGKGEVRAAYYDAANNAQNGTPTAIVSIHSYNVTFVANTVSGGKVENKDNHIVEKQLKIPSYAGFSLTAPGEGYSFDGWFSKDGTTSGDWGNRIVAGKYLDSDLTVYAKWKAPLTIKGKVYVAGSYIGENGDLISIYDHDRIDSVTIVLRKDGLGGNISTVNVPISYAGNLGTGEYEFINVPDDNSNYYIEERSSNYTGYFQNEPESRTNPDDYNSYAINDNEAVFGDVEPSIANINAYLKFDPASFDIKYQVDATAISDEYRPEKAEVEITYKDDKPIIDPSQWTVISQMKTGGDEITLTDGLGNGSTSVWNGFHDGATLYEYGMRVTSTEGLGDYTGSELPYHIEYQDPAYYVAGGQSKLLKATLIPNQYAIHYEYGVNSTAISGMTNTPKKHTWSYETAIDVEPVRSGYDFLGWYDNPAFTGDPVEKIAAHVSEETILYAKWIQVQDRVNLTVTIIHKEENGDGLASNYDKNLYVQLTHSLKDSGHPYEDVQDKTRQYDGSHWHTMGDGVEQEIYSVENIFTDLSSAYAYSLNVSLDDYIVTKKTVTPILDDESGITTYDVQVTLQFVPDLLYLTVNAEIAKGIKEELWPVSAEVKINCWYDHPSNEIGLKWNTITQHENTSLTLTFDHTGKGSVTYPVWQWLEKETSIPYYYRMEVVSLRLKDGSVVNMSGNEQRYTGGEYLADIETDASCEIPVIPVGTTLSGAYGKPVNGGGYSQTGTVTAIISTNIWNDDDTPDHMQAEIRFQSADDSMGTASGDISQVFTLELADGSYKKNVQPDEVILTPVTGYEFSHWENDEGTSVTDPFIPQEVLGGKTYTYTAHWKPVSNLNYKVNYLDMGGASIRTAKEEGGQIFGRKIQSADEIIEIPGYVYDHADKSEIVISTDEDLNVFNLYYAKDYNDDEVADYKQAFVEFLSDANGSVGGNTSQLFTFSEDDGYKGNVTLSEVTLTPATGYEFSHWTDKNDNTVGNPFESQLLEGGKYYNYTAHWKARSDYKYTVKYLDKKDNRSLALERVVENQIFNTSVTENAIPINGYMLDGSETQSFVIDVDNKVIVFYYNIRNDLTLTVKYREWGDDTETVLHPDVISSDMKFGDQPNLDMFKIGIHGYTYHSMNPNQVTIGTSGNELIVYYEKKNCEYTVEYYYDDVKDSTKTVTGTALYGTLISSYTDKVETGFVLDYVQGLPLTVGEHDAFNVIRVHYASDANNNRIPDKYEATVTFKVINGKWTSYKDNSMDTDADITETYPLYKNIDGKWIKIDDVKIVNVPSGTANTGYNNTGTWNPSLESTTPVTGNAVYTLNYNKEKYTITATVVNGSASSVGNPFTYKEVEHSNSDKTIITFEPRNSSYVIDVVRVDGINATLDSNNSITVDHLNNHNIYVSYEEDIVGGNTEEPGDKIPDKYQKKVTFEVVHGTWGNTTATEKVVYLTLKKDGKNDINGSASLTTPTDMQPAVGYVTEGSKWDVTPPDTVNGTHEEVFVYRYTQKQQVKIIIDVQGGTSYPVHSNTEYDYDATAHSIEFSPYAGFVLDTARIKTGDLSDAGTWNDLVWTATDANGVTRYSHSHETNQHIQVVYAKDDNGDNKADYKQVFVEFKSAENGSVSGEILQIYDFTSSTLTPKTVEKSASPGYVFSHWTDRDGNSLPDPIQNVSVAGGETYTFTANWIPRNDLKYKIQYVDENGVQILADKVVENAVYGSKILAADEKKDITDYVFISADKEEMIVGLEESENVIILTYGLDKWKDTPDGNDKETGGDEYPDSKQALVRFSSANETEGTVDGAGVIQVFSITTGSSKVVVPSQVDVNPSIGYVFSHWTEKGETDSVNPYEPITVTGNMVKEYVAHWEKRQDLSYTVNYFDLNGQKLEESKVIQDQTFGDVIYSSDYKITISGYVFDHADAESITIGVGTNVINLYYAPDSNGDDIADYKQFFVHFVSEDDQMGTVSHDTTQVFEIEKNSAGNYIGKVTPLRAADSTDKGVIVTAKSGYVEDFWSVEGNNTPVNPFVEMDAEGGNSVTFEVHFAEDADNTGYADKYEATVTYKVHQGYWNDTKDKADKTETFLLYQKNADTGWTLIVPAVTLGDKIPDVSNAVADASIGYKEPGHWGDKTDMSDDPISTTVVVDGAVYTYSFSELIPYTITVEVENGSFKVDDHTESSPITVSFGDDLKLDFDAMQEEGANYALESVTVDGAVTSLDAEECFNFEDIRANHSIKVVYGKDVWSDPERDKDPAITGDGISDNFQIKVNYYANPENFGSVSKDFDILTIVDANGAPVKQGDIQLLGAKATAKEADKSGVYSFVNWTDSLASYVLRAALNVVSEDELLQLELKDVNGGSEYHYYANFHYEMKVAAIYYVEYYLWNDNGNKYLLDKDNSYMGHAYVGDKVEAQIKNYAGYVFNQSKSIVDGIVTEPITDPSTMEPTNVLTLKLYYDLKDDDADKPGSKPEDKPDNKPEDKPGDKPGDKLGDKPGTNSEKTPENTILGSLHISKTGDEAAIGLWSGIMAAAAAGILSTALKTRKRKKSK